ncbi:hypothetical protein AYI70_g6430 [Smittium culicis]|uniref:Uncharacterized protein n=1 Tax=Smittium culicis TaxID=133412 RepID=A0A1R1XPZ1_9FUNG|nr:hypothetical protein AYI70_g6430 [Smittium culicis]
MPNPKFRRRIPKKKKKKKTTLFTSQNIMLPLLAEEYYRKYHDPNQMPWYNHLRNPNRSVTFERLNIVNLCFFFADKPSHFPIPYSNLRSAIGYISR